MKNLIFTILFCFLFTTLNYSQIDILGKVKDKVTDRTERKIDEGIDKGLDEVEEDMENKEEAKEEKEQIEASEEEQVEETKVKVQDKKAGLKVYSKYDFIAGEKLVFFDDFIQDNIGDFPLKWNTNTGGEVVEIEGMGKWFNLFWGGTYYPELPGPLPENFTIEFDILYDLKESSYPPALVLDIISTLPDEPMDNLVPGNGGVEFSFNHDAVHYKNWMNQSYGEISNSLACDIIEKKMGTPTRISIMVQKQRVRVWLEEKKVVDIPRMLPAGFTYDRIRFFQWGQDGDDVKLYIKNLKVAAGVPDMRSKLITEGKLVTHGIYFDSGSDKIRAESYGTLKEIANVLKENAGVRVQITGYTDSDGADELNLELSKKRSLSVRNTLSTEFGIDASRMDTDGKGESQPIDKNDTPEGKANNRRVEFIKL